MVLGLAAFFVGSYYDKEALRLAILILAILSSVGYSFSFYYARAIDSLPAMNKAYLFGIASLAFSVASFALQIEDSSNTDEGDNSNHDDDSSGGTNKTQTLLLLFFSMTSSLVGSGMHWAIHFELKKGQEMKKSQESTFHTINHSFQSPLLQENYHN